MLLTWKLRSAPGQHSSKMPPGKLGPPPDRRPLNFPALTLFSFTKLPFIGVTTPVAHTARSAKSSPSSFRTVYGRARLPRAGAREASCAHFGVCFGALTQNRSSLEDAPPRAVAIELRIGARFRHYLAASPAFSVTRTSTMRRSVVFRHCCHICRHSSTSRRSAQSGSATN